MHSCLKWVIMEPSIVKVVFGPISQNSNQIATKSRPKRNQIAPNIIQISNCLRPSRHRAQMCVPSALPLFRIGSRLHGQLFPSRLPALRGHTLSLVGRTLHTKSITKCNEKQNGTPANFENAPKFSCICLAVFPTVMKNKTECPTIFKKNDFKMRQFLHPLAPF